MQKWNTQGFRPVTPAPKPSARPVEPTPRRLAVQAADQLGEIADRLERAIALHGTNANEDRMLGLWRIVVGLRTNRDAARQFVADLDGDAGRPAA